MNNQTKGGWKDITNKIKTSIIGEQQTQTITTMNIKTKFADMINTKAEGKTKTQYLLNNTTWKPGIRKTYMNKLTRMEASTIFKARTRMLDVKNNYRGKHNNVTCRKCGEPTETQEHILGECKGIHTNNTTKVNKTDIFCNDHTDLRDTANKIANIMKKLHENTT